MNKSLAILLAIGLNFLLLAACGDDNADGSTEADRVGIAAECTDSTDCEEGLQCLTSFKGGYCGKQGCDSTPDCPQGAICVLHDDGMNYCFRACADKPECNQNRSLANEANCVGSFDWANPGDELSPIFDTMSTKACVPPSGS